MGIYLRGPHLGPLRSGVRLSGRGGSGCGLFLAVLAVGTAVAWLCIAVARYWYYFAAGLLLVAAVIVAVRRRRARRKPAGYWDGLDKVAEELRHATPEQRAAARAAVPDLTGSGWHRDDQDFLVRDEVPS